jgi:hypothetical protein
MFAALAISTLAASSLQPAELNYTAKPQQQLELQVI